MNIFFTKIVSNWNEQLILHFFVSCNCKTNIPLGTGNLMTPCVPSKPKTSKMGRLSRTGITRYNWVQPGVTGLNQIQLGTTGSNCVKYGSK